MPVNIKIINTTDFVKTMATGTFDFAASTQAILDIVSLIKTPGEYQVLVDTRGAEVQLSTLDIYELGVKLATQPALRLSKIALLAPARDLDKAHFLETVAGNRGAIVMAFTDFEAAISWLVMKDQTR